MFRKNESGQAVIILAVGVVVLLIFAALAIDAGNAYTAKREAQNAADAASMAATRQLVKECAKLYDGLDATNPVASNILQQGVDMVKTNAINAQGAAQLYYIDQNGTRLGTSAINPMAAIPCGCGAGTARGVEVNIDHAAPSFLAGLIGQKSLPVKVVAKARYGPVSQISTAIGVYPVTRRMGISTVLGDDVVIRDVKGQEDLPGNFGWLTWAGSPNANTLGVSMTPPGDSNTFINPHDPSDRTLNIGDWVEGATGNMASLHQELNEYWVNTGEVMIFPLYDGYEAQGANANYRVGGFAAVVITGYDFGGQDKHIDAKITMAVVNGDWSNVECSAETGVYSVKLTP